MSERGATPAESPPARRGSGVRTVGQHTLIYGVGIVLSKVAGFLMLPIYTRYLTPADYGILELLEMTINAVSTLAGAGIAASVFKFHADADSVPKKYEIISTATIGLTVIAALTTVIGLIAAPAVHGFVLRGAGKTEYVQMFFLIYFVQTVGQVPLQYLQIQKRSTLVVGIQFARLMTVLMLNVFFVVFLKIGVRGVMLGTLISSTATTIVLAWFTYARTGLHFSRATLQAMVRYGLPMVLVFLGNFLLVFSDRWFLNFYTNVGTVGIYSLAYRFAFLLSIFATVPFDLVWGPHRFEVAKQPDSHDVFRRVFFYHNLSLAVMSAGIALFSSEVIRIMAAPSFHAAAGVVGLLLVSQVMFDMGNFQNFGLLYTGQTRRFAAWSLIPVAVALALNVLLIPEYGMYGAALATGGAYLARLVTIYVLAHRAYPVSYGWSPVLRIYAVAAAICAVQLLWRPLPILPSLVLDTATFLCILGALYVTAFSPDERRALRRVVRDPAGFLLRPS